MARFDFLTDPDNNDDIIVNSKGGFSFTSTVQESVSQRLGIRLKTWKGTWSYNNQFGTPYRQEILYAGNSKEQVDAIFTRIISEVNDVTSIKNLRSSKNVVTRQYQIDRVEAYCNDELLVIPVSDPNQRTNTYPTPRTLEDFPGSCSLDGATIEDTNRLYNLVNYQLGLPNGDPAVGEYTWWNQWGGGSDPR